MFPSRSWIHFAALRKGFHSSLMPSSREEEIPAPFLLPCSAEGCETNGWKQGSALNQKEGACLGGKKGAQSLVVACFVLEKEAWRGRYQLFPALLFAALESHIRELTHSQLTN